MTGGEQRPAVTVRIPAQVRRLYGAQAVEQLQAARLCDVVDELERRYPGMGERLTEPDGNLRRWVNIFVNGEDVRYLDGLDTGLSEGSEVQIVPSVAGGVH
jgi:molybdopterin synthase sulfur carrier subunit